MHRDCGGGGTSSSKSNSTSLSQAEIDYREGRTPGYSHTSSNNNSSKTSSSKSSSKKSSNDDTDDSSNSAPQKSWQEIQEIAEKSNNGLVKWLVEQMEKVAQIKAKNTAGKTTSGTITNISEKFTTSEETAKSEAKKTTKSNSTSLSQAEIDYREGRTPGYSKGNSSTKTVAKVNINIKEVWDRVSGKFESLVDDLKNQVKKAVIEQAINSQTPTEKGETIFRNIYAKNRLFIL